MSQNLDAAIAFCEVPLIIGILIAGIMSNIKAQWILGFLASLTAIYISYAIVRLGPEGYLMNSHALTNFATSFMLIVGVLGVALSATHFLTFLYVRLYPQKRWHP